MNSNYHFVMTQPDGTTITVSGPGDTTWRELAEQFSFWLRGCGYSLPEGDLELTFYKEEELSDPLDLCVNLELCIYNPATKIPASERETLIRNFKEMTEYLLQQEDA